MKGGVRVIKELKCLRCKYKWFPRIMGEPKRCAGCKNKYWNKPIVYNTISKASKLRMKKASRKS